MHLVNTSPVNLMNFLNQITNCADNDKRLIKFFLESASWNPVAPHTRLIFINQGIRVFYCHDNRLLGIHNIDNVFMEMDQDDMVHARLAGLKMKRIDAIPTSQGAYIRYDMTKYPVSITGKQWNADRNQWVPTQDPRLRTMQESP